MNITSKNRRPGPEQADGPGTAMLRRRGVLGGLAAVPVLYALGGAASPASAAARPEGAAGAHSLVRGPERRYNAPLLTPGTRLVLPAGVRAEPVYDLYRRPRLAASASAWPAIRAADGTRIDASVVPEPGAPTRAAVLSGFADGWYELIHTSGRADRVTWDARDFPFLWFYGEFGATNQAPYKDRIYALALQPLSRNPYSHSTSNR